MRYLYVLESIISRHTGVVGIPMDQACLVVAQEHAKEARGHEMPPNGLADDHEAYNEGAQDREAQEISQQHSGLLGISTN